MGALECMSSLCKCHSGWPRAAVTPQSPNEAGWCHVTTQLVVCHGRVAIAGVLAQQPSVLLLDELTTFLDGEDQRAVLRSVRQLASPAAGVTVLWVPSKPVHSHQLTAVGH